MSKDSEVEDNSIKIDRSANTMAQEDAAESSSAGVLSTNDVLRGESSKDADDVVTSKAAVPEGTSSITMEMVQQIIDNEAAKTRRLVASLNNRIEELEVIANNAGTVASNSVTTIPKTNIKPKESQMKSVVDPSELDEDTITFHANLCAKQIKSRVPKKRQSKRFSEHSVTLKTVPDETESDESELEMNSFFFSTRLVESERPSVMHVGNVHRKVETDDDLIKKELFVESTHRYLFLDKITRLDGTMFKVERHHKAKAIAIITFQIYVYCFIGYLIAREIRIGKRDFFHPSIEIDASFCFDSEKYDQDGYDVILDAVAPHRYATLMGEAYTNLGQASITGDMLPNLIQCKDPTDYYDEGHEFGLLAALNLTASGLLIAFLMPDAYEAFVLLQCRDNKAKLIGTLILSKAVLAACVGSISIWLVKSAGMLNGFVSLVGLIFVHDVDEQFGYLQNVLEKRQTQNLRQFGILLIVCFVFTGLFQMILLPLAFKNWEIE